MTAIFKDNDNDEIRISLVERSENSLDERLLRIDFYPHKEMRFTAERASALVSVLQNYIKLVEAPEELDDGEKT